MVANLCIAPTLNSQNRCWFSELLGNRIRIRNWNHQIFSHGKMIRCSQTLCLEPVLCSFVPSSKPMWRNSVFTDTRSPDQNYNSTTSWGQVLGPPFRTLDPSSAMLLEFEFAEVLSLFSCEPSEPRFIKWELHSHDLSGVIPGLDGTWEDFFKSCSFRFISYSRNPSHSFFTSAI